MVTTRGQEAANVNGGVKKPQSKAGGATGRRASQKKSTAKKHDEEKVQDKHEDGIEVGTKREVDETKEANEGEGDAGEPVTKKPKLEGGEEKDDHPAQHMHQSGKRASLPQRPDSTKTDANGVQAPSSGGTSTSSTVLVSNWKKSTRWTTSSGSIFSSSHGHPSLALVPRRRAWATTRR